MPEDSDCRRRLLVDYMILQSELGNVPMRQFHGTNLSSPDLRLAAV
jgi:hypothetical protein